MLKKWLFILGLGIVTISTNYAQNSEKILLQIGNEKVETEEFWAIYQKNNKINIEGKKTDLDEYLDLFIKFKLKVKEAKDAHLDTNAAFVKELNGYRQQLVKPYLVIEEINEQTVKEVYARMQNTVRASHILLRLGENATPADTLVAYQKANKIREEILGGKYSFTDAAVLFSEDPSARDMDMGADRPKRPGNKGDLGYFGAFDMVYPFEEAVFHLKIGEISHPVQTRFGYHLILLTDKIPAFSQARAAHIFIQNAASESAIDSSKIKIEEIYALIQQGQSFEDLALRYSDDKGSSEKGGELPWFSANRMVPEFIEAISKMQIGEISKPLKTSFGWHILKYLELKPLGSFETLEKDINEKLKRDVRSAKGEQAKIAQIKLEENFQEFPEAATEALKAINSDFYNKDFDIQSLKNLQKPVFKIRDQIYTQFDFLEFVFARRTATMPPNAQSLYQSSFNEYKDRACLAFEEKHLEEKQFDFRLIMNEYREGLLLFEVMDKKVWSKASSDTLGLQDFFRQNQKKYQWKERAEISVFHFNDKSYFGKVKEMLLNKKTEEEILQEVKTDSLMPIRIETLKIEKGQNSPYGGFKWKKEAVYTLKDANGKDDQIVVFRELFKPEQKQFNQTRGLVIADYQDFLEKQWLTDLRAKYEIVVNKEALKELKKRNN